MIALVADKALVLPFPVFSIQASASGWLLLDVMHSRDAFVLDPGLSLTGPLQIGGRQLREISLAPGGKLLACTDHVAVRIFDVATGKILREERTEYTACRFVTDTELWLVRRVSKHDALAELYDFDSWRVLRSVPVPDLFGDAWFSLCHHSDTDVMCWINAQQDGQRLCRIARSGSSPASLIDGVSNGWQPAFDDTGEKFLIVHDLYLSVHAYPSGSVLGKLYWEEQLPEDQEGDAWLAAEYVGARRAVAFTAEGRIHLIDTDAMRILDSVEIPEHAGFRALYPLDRERMISIHGRTAKGAATTLAIWKKNLLGS